MTKMLNILLHKEVLTSVRKEIQLKMDQVPDKAIHKRIPQSMCVEMQTDRHVNVYPYQ